MPRRRYSLSTARRPVGGLRLALARALMLLLALAGMERATMAVPAVPVPTIVIAGTVVPICHTVAADPSEPADPADPTDPTSPWHGDCCDAARCHARPPAGTAPARLGLPMEREAPAPAPGAAGPLCLAHPCAPTTAGTTARLS